MTHGKTDPVHAGAYCQQQQQMGCKCITVCLPCRVIWAAIFDGHAGKQVAALASKHLHENTVLSGFLDALNFLVSYCTICSLCLFEYSCSDLCFVLQLLALKTFSASCRLKDCPPASTDSPWTSRQCVKPLQQALP